MEPITHTQIKPPLELLKSALAFYRQHFSSIVLVVVGPPVIGFILNSIFPLPFQWVGAAVLSLLNLLVQIVLIEFIYRDGSLSLSGAAGRLRVLFWPFLWVSLLAGFAGAGAFVALVVPGIIISVWLVFSSFLVVAEGRRGLEALVGSAGYVHGRFFPVLWYLVVYVLVAIVVSLVVLVPVSLLPFGQFISMILASLILSPVGTFYLFYLYRELKRAGAAHPVAPEVLARKRRWLQIFLIVGVIAAFVFLVFVGALGAFRLIKPSGQLGSAFFSLPFPL